MIYSCVSVIIGFQMGEGEGGLNVNRKNQKCLNLTPFIHTISSTVLENHDSHPLFTRALNLGIFCFALV